MPRTRFDKLAAPKRDPIKATILERKDATDTSLEAMAAALGVSVATLSRMLAKHTDAWPLGQINGSTASSSWTPPTCGRIYGHEISSLAQSEPLPRT